MGLCLSAEVLGKCFANVTCLDIIYILFLINIYIYILFIIYIYNKIFYDSFQPACKLQYVLRCCGPRAHALAAESMVRTGIIILISLFKKY